MPNILEIACFSIPSCLLAQKAGPHRIEFCSDYNSGGITPSEEEISEARKQIHIPLHIMIRPRKGNFVYTSEEIEWMKKTILFCKAQKIDGIVFGILTEANEINETVCKELVTLAKPMCCVFHRAIDECKNINKSVETLIEIGFDVVLTSGGAANAKEGIETIKHLQKKYGSKINIMPGGGIRPENIDFIRKESGCTTFHSSALNLNSKQLDVEMIHELLQAIKS